MNIFSLLVIQANKVFQDFLKSQINIEDSILQSDKALTDKERAMADIKEGSSLKEFL